MGKNSSPNFINVELSTLSRIWHASERHSSGGISKDTVIISHAVHVENWNLPSECHILTDGAHREWMSLGLLGGIIKRWVDE